MRTLAPNSAPRLLCSIGAFGRDPGYTDHRSVLRLGPLLPVDGLELIFYSDWYANLTGISVDLGDSGLAFPVVHVEKGIGPACASEDSATREGGFDRLDLNCRLAGAVGARLLVLHLWGLPDGDARIERNLAALPRCYDTVASHGLELAIETIPCDLADPLTYLRRAIEVDERCLIALDTEFLAYHGQLAECMEAGWMWTGGRVRHVHIKDYGGALWTPEDGRRYLHPGQGSIDFAAFFAALHARRFTGTVSLEASSLDRSGGVNLEELRRSLERIRAWLQGPFL